MAQRVSGAFARGLWGLGFSAGTCRTWPCACAPSNIPLQTAPCLRPASGLPASRWCRSGSAWHPAQPEDAAGFLQAGGHPLQREHPAQPCQQHHGAHRTASLNLFSLPLFHPASSVFCAVPRCFFSIISHPRCNLPESRGECTSVPLAPALKTV